jgi:LSD1 subclass zinc finger protein
MAQSNYDRVRREVFPLVRADAARLMAVRYGIRQQRIAQMLGVTQAAVSKYISGKTMPSGQRMDKEKLDAYVRRLLSGDSEGAQRYKCALCQSEVKFDCGIMVK